MQSKLWQGGFLASVTSLLLHPTAIAQQTLVIADGPVCATCRVELLPVRRIGALDDPGSFDPLSSLAVSGGGEYFVASLYNRGKILVYNTNGQFERTLGRLGRGPGEFEGPILLAIDGADTLHAIAALQGQGARFTPGLELIGTTSLPPRVHDFALLHNGLLLVSAPLVDGSLVYTAHVIEISGRALSSFDPVALDGSSNRTDPHLFWRAVAASSSNRVWSARLDEYAVTLWDSDGNRIKQLRRRPDWFVVSDQQQEPIDPAYVRPPARILDVYEYSHTGLLWILVAVPDVNWKSGRSHKPEDIYDTVIEIIDPDRAEVVVMSRFNDLLQLTRDGNYIYATRQDSSGFSHLMIWKPTIKE